MPNLTDEGLILLKAELTTDPAGVGYSGQAPGQMWKLLHDPAPAQTVARVTVSRDEFLDTFADVIDGIRTVSNPTMRAKWEWRLDKLWLPKDTMHYSNATMQAFLAEMVTDALPSASGPLTASSITARTTWQVARPSRADALGLHGVGVEDIVAALRHV